MHICIYRGPPPVLGGWGPQQGPKPGLADAGYELGDEGLEHRVELDGVRLIPAKARYAKGLL